MSSLYRTRYKNIVAHFHYSSAFAEQARKYFRVVLLHCNDATSAKTKTQHIFAIRFKNFFFFNNAIIVTPPKPFIFVTFLHLFVSVSQSSVWFSKFCKTQKPILQTGLSCPCTIDYLFCTMNGDSFSKNFPVVFRIHNAIFFHLKKILLQSLLILQAE